MAMELSKLNQRTNLAHWQQQVYECRHSGMTIKAWCAEHGISIKCYYYRQERVWKAAQDAEDLRERQTVKLSSQTQPGLSVPSIIEAGIPFMARVRGSEHQGHTSPSLIIRKDQWIVEAAEGCDPELLQLVLREVK